MRRRIAVSAIVLLIVAGLIVVGYWLLQPHPRIDKAALDRIELGMTEAQVVEIIGAPPGNYGLGDAEFERSHIVDARAVIVELPDPASSKSWMGQTHGIEIGFDANGKVVTKDLHTLWREYDSHFDWMCQTLRIREKKPRMLIYY